MPAIVHQYLELTKPRVVALIVFTAVIGMLLAVPGMPPLRQAIAGAIGIWLAAASAAALNHLIDQRIDKLMARTSHRPLATGTLTPTQVLAFALILGTLSMAILIAFVNPLTAALTFASLIGYAVVYTAYLKRATPQNIVIGGLAGAMPPMVAWAAATGTVGLESAVLVALIFMWTPPHFWALCLIKSDDYARAGVPMLTCVAGPDETRRQVLLYSLALGPLGLAPAFVGLGGPIYLAVSIVVGVEFIRRAFVVYRVREGDAARKAAGKLFGFSLIHLFALFFVLIAEKLIGIAPLTGPVPGWM